MVKKKHVNEILRYWSNPPIEQALAPASSAPGIGSGLIMRSVSGVTQAIKTVTLSNPDKAALEDTPSTTVKLESPDPLDFGNLPPASLLLSENENDLDNKTALNPLSPLQSAGGNSVKQQPPPPAPRQHVLLKRQSPVAPVAPPIAPPITLPPGPTSAGHKVTVGFKLLPSNKFHGAVLRTFPEGWVGPKVVINEAGFQKVFYYNKSGKKFSSFNEVQSYFTKLGYSDVCSDLFDFSSAQRRLDSRSGH